MNPYDSGLENLYLIEPSTDEVHSNTEFSLEFSRLIEIGMFNRSEE